MPLRPAPLFRSLALARAPIVPVSTIPRRFAGSGPHYNEPTGYLFGEKPPPAGQKRKWEDWEAIWYFGYGGVILFAIVGLMYKPDTGIQTWALEEAKRRMEARGDLPKYVPSQPDTAVYEDK